MKRNFILRIKYPLVISCMIYAIGNGITEKMWDLIGLGIVLLLVLILLVVEEFNKN